MGAWGYYDDENDCILDIWGEITETYQKKFHLCLNLLKEEDSELYYTRLNKIIKTERIKFGKFVADIIKSSSKKYNNREKIGIIIGLTRLGSSEGKVPRKLYPKFPVSLKKLAYKIIKHLINNFEEEKPWGWRNIKEREKILQKELKLFT